MKTREEVTKEFKADLAALLAKYHAEISIREDTSGYYTSVVGIEFDFDGVYDVDYNAVSEFGAFNIGTWANKDSFNEKEINE